MHLMTYTSSHLALRLGLVAWSSECGIHAVVSQAARLLALALLQSYCPSHQCLFFISTTIKSLKVIPLFHIPHFTVSHILHVQCPVSKHALGVSPSLLGTGINGQLA